MNSFKDLDQAFPQLRLQYTSGKLEERDLVSDPVVQFRKWFQAALRSKVRRPNVMTLATAGKNGKPSARTVLLKGFDKKGFVFFTNYQSRKGKDIDENPFGTLVFYWPEVERQVIVRGRVERISRKESGKYFQLRPRDSRLAAWVSRQGEEIKNRRELEKRFNRVAAFYENREIPLPPYWGGYELKPETLEFWQGRKNRLNDRILYTKSRGRWRKKRLQP
ncbi:MAG: pyridoxamine 5'-phosphate oxidase [Candidatus Omnitrophica bacterium]|nr:pyridoxamine 5'-phosphate oxidase [Candidatus Omnitrophota bacterium]